MRIGNVDTDQNILIIAEIGKERYLAEQIHE